MKILIAGGTGFVGQFLIPALLKDHHELLVLGRNPRKIQKLYQEQVKGISWSTLASLDANNIDAVINLAGHNISGRWTNETKKLIKQSRTSTTTLLAKWCANAEKKPHLYNTSAIGIYGLQPLTAKLPPALDEATLINFGHPKDFLSEVGQAWEQAAQPAIDAGVPVTFMRFAVVLKRDAGMLKKIIPSYSLGLGGIVGSGHQPFCWVHVDDLVRAIQFLLQHPNVVGAVNICAPECVSQKTFAQLLARTIHRPAFMRIPTPIVKLLFGQMGEELLLRGQNVFPEHLFAMGFIFDYPNLASALEHDWP